MPILTLVLAGCPQEYSLTVEDLTDPSRPELCFSRFSRCIGAGAFFSNFVVYRWNAERGPDSIVWKLKPVGDGTLGRVRYGVAPDGWVEEQLAQPLLLGETYCFGDRYCLCLRSENGVVGAVVIDALLEPESRLEACRPGRSH